MEATELYSPWRTPASAFIEWGVGIDLYFSTLRSVGLILLVAGLINLPNILFYGGADYSPDGKSGLPFTLRTTAICTTGEWVVCPDCQEDQFRFDQVSPSDRFRVSVNGTVLVLRNACDGGQLPQGMVNFATGWFLAIVLGLVSIYLRAREVRFEEDKLRASDYSVVIRNPPPDALDPDEWHAFFSQFADKTVTAVTIALNNQVMLEKLIARRYHLHNLRLMLPKGVDLEDEDIARAAVAQLIQEQSAEPTGCVTKCLCCVAPLFRVFGFFLTPDQLVDRIFKLREEIKELQKLTYGACSVIVTFETEDGQRSALSALSTGKVDVMANNTSHVAPGVVFRGFVLQVGKPSDPSSIRYLDLSASSWRKISTRILNLVLTLGIVSLAGFAVSRTRQNLGANYAGPLVSIFNSIIPLIIKLLMMIERHTTEGSYQTSLYLKITLFRWINTAVLTKLITPFVNTVSPGDSDVLVVINAILWSELFIVPALRLLDLFGNVKKHILGPRARNQEIMNLSFQGTYYNIGERYVTKSTHCTPFPSCISYCLSRYTDMTKILFVVFFYAALFPSAFFFGSAILFVQYYASTCSGDYAVPWIGNSPSSSPLPFRLINFV